MTDFKIGDYIYGEDWCYGRIFDMNPDGYIFVEFETPDGGDYTYFTIDEVTLAEPPLTHIYEEGE